MPRRGKCRACGCTGPKACAVGCDWSDKTKTHCTACVCVDCGARFVTTSDYVYDETTGARMCRGRKKCAERMARNEATRAFSGGRQSMGAR